MLQKIDLLVHAGAPSSRQDDQRYRAQAKAYLAFQGHHSVKTPLHPPLPRLRSGITEHTTNPDGRDVSEAVKDGTTVFLDDTQLAYGALDSQLATSSLIAPRSSPFRSNPPRRHGSQQLASESAIDARKSPERSCVPATSPEQHIAARGSANNSHGETNSVNGGEDPYEVQSIHRNAQATPEANIWAHGYSQSSYLKTPIMERSVKKRRLDINTPRHDVVPYMPLPDESQIGLAYIGERSVADASRPEYENTHSQNSNIANENTSELPTSYSLSDITSENSRARARQTGSQRSATEPGPAAASISPMVARACLTATKVPQQANDFSTQPEKTKGQPSITAELADAHKSKTDACVHNTSDTASAVIFKQATNHGHRSEKQVQKLSASNARSSDSTISLREALNTLPTTIRPSEAQAGSGCFITHVTDKLRWLVDDANIADHYNPVSTAREIRPLERGHWSVNCASWPLKAQIDFWLFLEKTVARGHAGWGVWCVRGDEDEGPSALAACDSLGLAKVFCWGEVVKHIFLLLYVASSGKIRKLGLQWIDAEGKMVVQMREE